MDADTQDSVHRGCGCLGALTAPGLARAQRRSGAVLVAITLDIPVTITPVPVGSVVIDSATFQGDTMPTAIDAAVPIALYSDTLNDGDQIVLQATVMETSNNDLATRRRVWTTLDTAVAKVGADGTVTAVGPGSTQIVAAAGGVADSVTFNLLRERSAQHTSRQRPKGSRVS